MIATRNSIARSISLLPKRSNIIVTRLNFSTKPRLFQGGTTTTTTNPVTPPSPPSKNKSSSRKWIYGIGSLSLLALCYNWYCQRTQGNNDFITIHKDLKPYTMKLSTNDTPFQTNYTLVGSGVRILPISTFKVYALGIYMADEDLPLVSKILDTKYLSKTFIDDDKEDPNTSHAEKVKAALNDPVKSEIIINSLLDGGVRFLIKMTPIIKSNLTFIREGGIIKSLKNSPEYNDLERFPGLHDIIDTGINDIRKAYNRKGSLVINDDLVMELNHENAMKFYYYNVKQNKFFTMGQVTEPLLGKILFRNYLSANKPLCEEARRDFVEKIVELL